jgi:hypothetical protein
MKNIILFLLLTFYITTSLHAQIYFEDIKGVWNNILSLDYVINEDFQPRRLIADNKTYLGWGSSVIVEKGNLLNYSIFMNGGYDDIIESYWSNNMLVLIVENSYGKTRGEIGITFIDRDTIFFTLVSGNVSTPFYFGKESIYIRASIVDEVLGTIEDAPKGVAGKALDDAGITTGEDRADKRFVFYLVAAILFIVGGSLIFISVLKKSRQVQ